MFEGHLFYTSITVKRMSYSGLITLIPIEVSV